VTGSTVDPTRPTAEGQGIIVVAGEALYDIVLSPTGEMRGHPGGAPFNLARTIGRLGQPVAFLGRISRDRFGAELLDELAADAVNVDSVVATSEPTTLAIAELGEGGAASYHFYTVATSAPGLEIDDATTAMPDLVDTLVVGGLGLVLEPVASTLEAVVERSPRETLVALDPNCRPAIIENPGAYRERLSRMLRHSDLVKVSEEDLEWLSPGGPYVETARTFLEDGPRVALVTTGPRGAIVVTTSDQIPVPAPSVNVVDTIGAGDAFAGAFLAWWRRNGLGGDDLGRLEPVLDATRFACLVAARTCERAGATPPRLSELEKYVAS
jgi:fructokinase